MIVNAPKGTIDIYGDYYKKYSFHRDRNGDDYDYGRAPDLLVIHLGANDSTNKQTTKEGFTNKAKELGIEPNYLEACKDGVSGRKTLARRAMAKVSLRNIRNDIDSQGLKWYNTR